MMNKASRLTTPVRQARSALVLENTPTRPAKRTRLCARTETTTQTERALGGAGDAPPSRALHTSKPSTSQETLDCEEFVRKGIAKLSEVCPKMREVVKKCGVPQRLLVRWGKTEAGTNGKQIDADGTNADDGEHRCFRALVRSVVYQQLAGAAANTIHTRVVATLGGHNSVTPTHVKTACSTREAELRAAGLSQRKLEYIGALAEEFVPSGGASHLDDASLRAMGADEAFEKLVKIRGIGPWTVHMFLMFTLGHADVLPVGDLVVARGIAKLYGVPVKDKAVDARSQKLLVEATEHWRPYRSLGSMLMWEVAGTKTV